ncbi:ClpP-like prohead protease/major capsid protein fusion protein [Nitrosococcus halophilus]|uniref:ClpP-like prohead protease/major capsid protein fusion protein n=1 Tax=Nitrosococcus halophilus TaxID=133539 RepID=UPI0012FF16F9|nr:ClpP-like prohead protease/major capsid protein fusion protein [Nitrosococcus halophilus]
MADDSAEIYIYGDIGGWDEESIDARRFVQDLASLEARLITARINSIGGSVYDGLAIHNALVRHPAQVTTTIDGIAASIASLIAMAGEERTMASNALLMVHAPWTLAIGNSEEFRRMADMLDKHSEAMTAAYAEATGQSAEDILALLTDGEDHYYTAEEAQALGFVHSVGSEQPVPEDLTAMLARRYPSFHSNKRNQHMLFGKKKSRTRPAPRAGTRLAAVLNGRIDALTDEDTSRSDIIAEMAREAGIREDTVNQILNGSIDCPPLNRLEGFSQTLEMPLADLRSAAEADGVNFGEEGNPAAFGTRRLATPQGSAGEGHSEAVQAALRLEANRRKDIKNRFQRFMNREGVAALLEECLDDPSIQPQDASDQLLAHMGQGVEPIQGRNFVSGEDSRDKFVRGATSALLARMGAEKHDRANPYRGMRLHEIARSCLKDAGLNVDGQTPEEYAAKALSHGLIRGAQTTSDFPVILENTLHKMILTGFMAIATTWDRICKVGDVTDFRAWNRLVPGLIGNLDGVNQAGEYLNKNIPDAEKNTIQVSRHGNIIQITPETIVNDDLGYVQDMANGLGGAGGRAIERAVYTLLESNPTMSDGTALFHANHGNLAASGAAPTVDLLDSAAVAMAQQKAPGDDAEYLDIRPAVALVNTSLRGNMRVLVDAVFDPDTANKLQKPNKVNGIVQDIVDTPRVAANPWYLFADPAIAPVLEVVFLNGQREPRLEMEENFRTSGLAWKVELPFGVAAIDYRGAFKNPGA